MMKKNTFPRLVSFTSPSLSFKASTVEVSVLERNPQKKPGVSWCVGGHQLYDSSAYKLFEELRYSAKRTSIYASAEDSAFKLCSPEHLAAVFLMWPSRNFVVNLPNAEEPEVPMMDGSALPFFSMLRRVAGVPDELDFYEAPVRADFDLVQSTGAAASTTPTAYGHVHIEPSEAFEVEYVLTDIGSSAMVSIYSAEDLYTLFAARTFIKESDYRAARRDGLLEGVDESCGLLLPDSSECSEKICNYSDSYRVREEPALHKILDLLGDIAFVCPALPKVRIEIVNGGHLAHNLIIKKVQPYVSTRYSSQV